MTVVLDEVWSAVGDPNRRRLIDLLLDTGESTPTKLSGQLPLTRQAVSKHLAVLQRAGLVTAKPHGREVSYRLDSEEFNRVAHGMAEIARNWDRRLRRIQAIAEAIEKQAERDNDS